MRKKKGFYFSQEENIVLWAKEYFLFIISAVIDMIYFVLKKCHLVGAGVPWF